MPGRSGSTSPLSGPISRLYGTKYGMNGIDNPGIWGETPLQSQIA
jgi:hypothetical protein